MDSNIEHVEDLLADESFVDWYFKKDAAAIEKWNLWMNEHPARKELVQEAVAMLANLTGKEKELPALQAEAAKERLLSNLNNISLVVPMKPRTNKWWFVAAAAIIFVVLSVSLSPLFHTSPYAKTSYGELKKQLLPDGSEVTLNANSSVTLSKGWEDGRDREVWIDGEAFFHVKRTPHRTKFIVHTSRFDIIVTGTRFNVLDRHGRSNVLLKEGSVIIHGKDNQQLNMKPGDFVAYVQDKLQKKIVTDTPLLAWTEKKLIFENTTIKELAQVIEDHYGVKVIPADAEVGNRKLTGIMPNDNLDVLLQTLKALDYSIEKKDDRIIIRHLPEN